MFSATTTEEKKKEPTANTENSSYCTVCQRQVPYMVCWLGNYGTLHPWVKPLEHVPYEARVCTGCGHIEFFAQSVAPLMHLLEANNEEVAKKRKKFQKTLAKWEKKHGH